MSHTLTIQYFLHTVGLVERCTILNDVNVLVVEQLRTVGDHFFNERAVHSGVNSAKSALGGPYNGFGTLNRFVMVGLLLAGVETLAAALDVESA